jgi:hypothetical protein
MHPTLLKVSNKLVSVVTAVFAAFAGAVVVPGPL